ncbi:hypothetical protein [Sphingomonas colocasiae]|uniref:DUF2155 domain-containing protein n=1 Tax=Sphingomonas colocasiae TaxID=1848973 RepID=A0ABS7PU01_9SPHN|nr:hypothetical protein [Sphingomonas colocasiae]MBY8823877.1 hypothetical protein [Sphingomonas colocasiae]
MRLKGLLAGLAFSVPAMAQAGMCEDNFVKAGSPVSGLRFIATISVAQLTPASAIGQMRGLVAPRNYDILAEEAEEGSMLIEQPMSGSSRAFPIIISASSQGGVGTVRMEAKLRAAMFVKEAAVMTELCGILNQIKGGKAGLAAAEQGRSVATGGGAPLAINSIALSHQISKDTERNPAAVPLRYKGRSFTVSGMVDHVVRDGEFYRVAFKIPNPWEEAIRLPNTAPFKTDISCLMAKGQAAYALTLKPDKTVKLTGSWYEFDAFRHVVWLKDCRPTR